MIPENFSPFQTAIANHIWQSTLFALAAASLTLPLRRNQAQIRYSLWLAASIKFLVPFSLLTHLGSHFAGMRHVTGTPAFYFVIEKVSQPFGQAPRGLLASLLPLLPRIVALVWAAGFVTVMALYYARWQRAATAKKNAAPLSSGREVEALRRLEQAQGMRRPIPLFSSQSSLEPGVFGIVRPILLWPEKISQHLDDAHMEAIVAHEVQHVRRRDNLAAAIHMVVEAIFWFHPVVWWVGARLLEERERACDEVVLELGSSPQIYAESILKTCEFGVSSSLACVSGIAGGDLKRRIVRIMSAPAADKLGLAKKIFLAVIGIGAVAGPIAIGLVRAPFAVAQSASPSTGSQGAKGTAATVPAHAPEQKIYQVGNGVSAPTLIFAPDPQYTEEASKARYQGVCVLSLIVDAKGKPQRVQVVRHLGMGLDQKAVEAVKQYQFEPAMLSGKPVPVKVNIEVNFKVN
jgi:bla regulator protein blaR1